MIQISAHLESIAESKELTINHQESAFCVDIQANETIKFEITLKHLQ